MSINKKVGKKPVTRHAVASCFESDEWPFVSADLQARILASLVALLLPLGDYRRSCRAIPARTRRRKPSLPKSVPSAPEKTLAHGKVEEAVIYGLNACTRALQDNIDRSDKTESICVLCVCIHDLVSPLLHRHFITLAHLSRDAGAKVHLVALPPGAEAALAKSLALPRVGCIGLKMREETQDLIQCVGDQVEPPIASLLQSGAYRNLVVKTTISQPKQEKRKRVRGIKSTLKELDDA